ncbi:Endonuclease/exonuclease/phosphatase family domain-containing protein 1 [Operophtera brumata]|uniref:Endonuclease/exonuclease/phosphatase family domain-containing protein 1 n=1 Tax=Operophtera brumata TaxID=104452 RepID=A0A0L7KYG4_OPEBR|nr:Endonuclease/exonuclease/phosphatase family domain-containing protein 1 [Operophtera brumata]
MTAEYSATPIFLQNSMGCIGDEELVTTVDANAKGVSSILCPGTIDSSQFNGHSGAIKSGLSHLAIPRGWSWGGPASPFCPIWAEINVPD